MPSLLCTKFLHMHVIFLKESLLFHCLMLQSLLQSPVALNFFHDTVTYYSIIFFSIISCLKTYDHECKYTHTHTHTHTDFIYCGMEPRANIGKNWNIWYWYFIHKCGISFLINVNLSWYLTIEIYNFLHSVYHICIRSTMVVFIL